MTEINLKVKLVDKHKIFPMKAKYDPNTRIAEVKLGFRRKVHERFKIDPDHIYEEPKGFRKKELVCYVDTSTRESIMIERVKEIIEDGKKRKEIVKEAVEVGGSIKLHGDGEVDQKKRNMLDFLIERSFWSSIIGKHKMPLSTVLIMLFAGAGLYHVVLVVLKVFGFEV